MNITVRFNREPETENEREFLAALQAALQQVADTLIEVGVDPGAVAELIGLVLPKVLAALPSVGDLPENLIDADVRAWLKLVVDNDPPVNA